MPSLVSPAYFYTYGFGSSLGGYGYQPGSQVYSLSTQWRGRYLDWTGFIYKGARYYDYQSGKFLSCDPMGHDGSMSLYDYCGGDPVNNLDPDGRVGKNIIEGTVDFTGNTVAGFGEVQFGFKGIPYDGTYSGAFGRQFGRDLGLTAGLLELGSGAFLAAGGAGVETVSLGTATPIAVPVAAIGIADAGAGIYALHNWANLSSVPTPTENFSMSSSESESNSSLGNGSSSSSGNGVPSWRQYEIDNGGQQTTLETTFNGGIIKIRLDKPPTATEIIDFKDYDWSKPAYETPFIQQKVVNDFQTQISKYQTINPNVNLQFSRPPPQWVIDAVKQAGGTYSVKP